MTKKHDAMEGLSEVQMERLIRFFDYLISDEILADIAEAEQVTKEQPNDQEA